MPFIRTTDEEPTVGAQHLGHCADGGQAVSSDDDLAAVWPADPEQDTIIRHVTCEPRGVPREPAP